MKTKSCNPNKLIYKIPENYMRNNKKSNLAASILFLYRNHSCYITQQFRIGIEVSNLKEFVSKGLYEIRYSFLF